VGQEGAEALAERRRGAGAAEAQRALHLVQAGFAGVGVLRDPITILQFPMKCLRASQMPR
jgi:hypothetical protein